MITFEDWKYINECIEQIPEKYQKEFFEECLGFDFVEVDGLCFDKKTVRKNMEMFLDSINR